MAIDLPDNLRARPFNGVSLELVMVAKIVMESSSAVSLGVALAKIIGLDLVVVGTQPLPVNLVEIIGLQDGTADDAGAGSCLDFHIHSSEHDVPVGLQERAIALLGHGEDGTIVPIGDLANGFEVIRGALGEIKACRLSQSGIGRTG